MQKIDQKRNIFPLFLYICPEPVATKDQAMANGTLIHQWDFHAGATQIWDIELYNGGPYYTISSTATTTPCYLGVENDSSAEYASVILRSGTVTDGMLWRIEKQSSGNFKDMDPFDAIDCLCHEMSHKLGLQDHYCYCNNHLTFESMVAHGCDDCQNENCSMHEFGEDAPYCMMTTLGNLDVEEMLSTFVSVEDMYCEDCIFYLSMVSRTGVW